MEKGAKQGRAKDFDDPQVRKHEGPLVPRPSKSAGPSAFETRKASLRPGQATAPPASEGKTGWKRPGGHGHAQPQPLAGD